MLAAMDESLAYRELRDADHGRIQGLLDDCFGAHYRTVPTQHSARRLDLVATHHDQPIAFASGRLGDILLVSQAAGEELWPAIAAWDTWQAHDHYLLLESAAVHANWRNRGIHAQLVRLRLAWARSQGATAAVSFTWRPEREDFAACTLHHCGFAARAHVPDYWARDARERDYHCPHCEDGCRCTMTLHVLENLPDHA